MVLGLHSIETIFTISRHTDVDTIAYKVQTDTVSYSKLQVSYRVSSADTQTDTRLQNK